MVFLLQVEILCRSLFLSGVPVLNITGGYGYIAGVATTATTASSNIATITLTTAAASGIFPVGSWITVAGVTPTVYNLELGKSLLRQLVLFLFVQQQQQLDHKQLRVQLLKLHQ